LERRQKSAFAFAFAGGREVPPRRQETTSMMNESEEGEHEDDVYERVAHSARDASEVVRGPAADEEYVTDANWRARAIP
jgi:hypothetical protein